MKGINTINKKGFTLVELLIVVAIIGILAGIAVPLYLSSRTRAVQTEAKSNLEQIRVLEEQFRAENGRYAPFPNGTVFYTVASRDIQNQLPGFTPGIPQNLQFDYQVTSSGANGENFLATATGKAGTLVENNTFTINQNNEKSW